MRVVFFGSSKFVVPIIEVLAKNFDLSLVLTTEKLSTDPIPSYCIKSKVRYYIVTDFKDKKLISYLANAKAPIGLLASFGAIVPNEVLNIFPKGIINIHPSLLPKYRGPTPVQTAILNGDKTTGVTIIKLDEEIDHGPILEQIEDEILPNDTSESLYDRLFKLSASSIVSTIELYLERKIIPFEQDHKKATFIHHLTRQNGYIDLTDPPSPEKLDRMIRAYYPWPGVWTKLKVKSEKLKVIKFLPRNLIQVEGKKPMSYKNLENGYGSKGKELLEKLQLS